MRSRTGRRICMCKASCSHALSGYGNQANSYFLGTRRIVGKGNHSKDHVQKIKPRVEQVCRELGLQFATEENAGRMYINLQGGPAVMPPAHSYQQGGQQQQQHHGGNQQHNGGYQQGYGQQQQGGYPGGPQQGGGGQNQNNNNNNDELEKLAKKFLPKIIRKLEGCCSVM